MLHSFTIILSLRNIHSDAEFSIKHNIAFHGNMVFYGKLFYDGLGSLFKLIKIKHFSVAQAIFQVLI